MPIFPIILTGDTLNVRHRNLNALVDNAYNSGVKIQDIQSIPEQTPVDRLFKIDLASKLRDVDFIIKNLKDDDMLYVSSALKCGWLLENEYENIVNPEYLENELFPHMIKIAVSKMKCWISVHLKEPERCHNFYQYYHCKNFDLAIKFLTHCQVPYILTEIPKILNRLSPFYLKVFCERSPQVAKTFFNAIATDDKVKSAYLNKEKEYYDCTKVVLKSDSNIFLDITETYYNNGRFKNLSPTATKYIMTNCKERFMKKTELYAAWLLDTKTMADCLTAEESQEVVLRLARAAYLDYWFNYKTVEPLFKRLSDDSRSAFKKKIFVEKDIGDKVEEWPYDIPSQPSEENKTHLFDDKKHVPYDSDSVEDDEGIPYRYLSGRCLRMDCEKIKCSAMVYAQSRLKPQTLLDKLFDEYRFVSFEKTLFELRKKIVAESSSQNRQFMMLVLVSKTGGRAESVGTLLQLLSQHGNEPSHVRATIVRSLVKRAFVWRLPQKSWDLFLIFARGLGLDGKPPEADCREGLHAAVLRSLLENGRVEPEILAAFIKEFSTLKEYSLSAAELKIIADHLPPLLLASVVNENDSKKQVELFNLLFQTLDDYKLPIDTCPVVPALAALANRDTSAAESLILRLFNAKKARRELFRENFASISTDASYLNALCHNTEVLKIDKYVKRILDTDSRKYFFLRKLATYFTESNGLAELYLSAVKQSVTRDPDVKLARPVALLIGSNIDSYLKQLSMDDDKAVKRFTVALKANAHLAKPLLDIGAFGWQAIGAKAVANRVIVCRDVDVSRHVQTLLKYPRMAGLAIALSQRSNLELDTFAAVAEKRPNVALKCAIKYLRHNPDTFKPGVWEIIKPALKSIDIENKCKYWLSKTLWKVDNIPRSIRAEYCTILLMIAKKTSNRKATSMLNHIENLLPEVNDEFLEDLLSQYLQTELTTEKVLKHDDNKMKDTCLYLRLLVKFVLLSKSEDTQKKRFEIFAEPFLQTMKSVWDTSGNRKAFGVYFKELMKSLRYNAVFFNEDYVSCLPVFERFVTWMHTILPMEMYFNFYGEIHLTTLYFKTVRQCIKHKSDIFKDDKKKCKEGLDLVGKTFGNYIAKEVEELKSRYFESIVELYGEVLSRYLNEYIMWDSSRETLVAAIIKGIAENGQDTTPLVGMHIFREQISYLRDTEVGKQIIAVFSKKDNREVHFFLDSEYRM